MTKKTPTLPNDALAIAVRSKVKPAELVAYYRERLADADLPAHERADIEARIAHLLLFVDDDSGTGP